MLLFLDVNPLSLGIETVDSVTSNIIDHSTSIPIEKSKIYHTPYDNCTEFDIDIYEGEEKSTNNLLGKFTLSGIEPADKGVAQINVTLTIDANVILKVSAVENAYGEDKNITITKISEPKRLDSDKIDSDQDDVSNKSLISSGIRSDNSD